MKVTQIMKKALKRGLTFAVAALMLCSFGFGTSAAAFVPYSSYTYDYDGNAMESPHGYVADTTFNQFNMNFDPNDSLKDPADLFLGSDGYIYIADTGNNRIVILDSDLQYVANVSAVYNEGAIIPKVQEMLKTEEENAEKKFNRKLTSYAEEEPENNPAEYKLSFAQFQEIQKRMSPYYNTDNKDIAAAALVEYAAIVSEYTAKGCIMPPYERIMEMFNSVYPVKYVYDGIDKAEIDQIFNDTGRGKNDEEKRCSAYFEKRLKATENDPSNDKLNAPEGVFLNSDGLLYVADTGNGRVVVIERIDDWASSVAVEVIGKPESSILSKEFEFKPMNLVMDTAGRMYINIKNVNSGIMQLSSDREFMGFYGAQQVTGNVWQWFTRLFQSDEQRARTVNIVPRVYNNVAIDHKNFVWVTANSMDQSDLFAYLTSGASATAPIKRLNPSGADVLVRNGVWAPGGDVVEQFTDVSSIVDVAVKGETGIYTLVDDVRNKLFTYDPDGNLLYAFGGTGRQLGVFQRISAAVYQGTDLLVLDKGTGYITRFKQTEYATLIETALTADDEREFALSEECWKEVQKLNSNFDLAYIGLAKCYLRSAAQVPDAEKGALYQKAMEYYKLARDTKGYSNAFKEYRSLYVRDHLLLILLIAAALFTAVYFAIRALNKENEKLHITGTATTLKEELCYGWRVIFHPINGFWEIKREKRGSMRAAFILLGAAVVAFCFNATGTAYIFNNVDAAKISLLQQASNVLIPVVLWVVASWCFTTLMSGEGSMKDIFIALCYGLIPLILILIPTTLFSNICSLDEGPFLTFFSSLAYGWMLLLVVFGSMVVQDYSFSKNLLTVILSVLGMAAIMFIIMLLISLTGKMVGFFGTLVEEIAFRL